VATAAEDRLNISARNSRTFVCGILGDTEGDASVINAQIAADCALVAPLLAHFLDQRL
jgi:hypothetical protein